MDKKEIIGRLEKCDQTILSFPDRGEWGNAKYRGNCSGWIHAFLIWKYNVTKMAELFAGSGTGYDVAKDMNISYVGADLNAIPSKNIIPVNALTDDVPDSFYGSDMVFMHPPYGAEIGIPYAGYQYPDPTGELVKYDLGQMQWDKFMASLNEIVMKYFAALEAGGRMAILMGDVRRNGKFHSMLSDIVKPNLEQIIIKAQHNYSSQGKVYGNRNFVPITHEYLMVLKKIAPYTMDYLYPKAIKLDIRDSQKATWKDVVFAAVKKIGRACRLEEIYREIEGHSKCKSNPNWKAKVRQVLQQFCLFENVEFGIWQLAA